VDTVLTLNSVDDASSEREAKGRQ